MLAQLLDCLPAMPARQCTVGGARVKRCRFSLTVEIVGYWLASSITQPSGRVWRLDFRPIALRNSSGESKKLTIKHLGNYNLSLKEFIPSFLQLLLSGFDMAPQCRQTVSPMAFILKTASALGFLVALCSTAFAQVDPGNGGRRLAPGVLKVVPSALNARDTFSLPTQMPELKTKAYQPKLRSTKETLHGLAQRVGVHWTPPSKP